MPCDFFEEANEEALCDIVGIEGEETARDSPTVEDKVSRAI
jgi:hypothetical protein